MHRDEYDCDKCGKLMPKEYDPRSEKLRIVVREDERFVGPPHNSYETSDICLACLVKVIREWFYENSDVSISTGFANAKEFCEMLKEKEEKNVV